MRRLRSPELSRSGKGGISSSTVASTSREVILDSARYSLGGGAEGEEGRRGGGEEEREGRGRRG